MLNKNNYSTRIYRANRDVYDNPRIDDRGFRQHLAVQEAKKILETDPEAFIGEALNEDTDTAEDFIRNVIKLIDKLPSSVVPDDLLEIYDDALKGLDQLVETAKIPLAQKRYPELF